MRRNTNPWKQCDVEGCEAPARTRGAKHCGLHHNRIRKNGEPGPIEPARPQPRGICTVDGCEKIARAGGNPYCEMHYCRLRRIGSTELTRMVIPCTGECSVEGCGRPDTSLGMCGMHATRLRRHGDPLVVIAPEDRNVQRGGLHPSWTGDDATRNAAHQRIHSQRGSASGYACVDCGGPALHWSYDHEDPDERISEDGQPYSPDVNHYSPRCASCHKRFDYAVLRRKGRVGASPRCGKPMEIHRGNRVSEISETPVCGRIAGHTGPCRSVESYQYTLRRNAQQRVTS